MGSFHGFLIAVGFCERTGQPETMGLDGAELGSPWILTSGYIEQVGTSGARQGQGVLKLWGGSDMKCAAALHGLIAGCESGLLVF